MKILYAFVLFCVTQVFFAQSFRKIPNEYVMVAAHRGDWHFAPENSLKGIELCLKKGVDILETDVRLTLDDKLILMHDYTLDRTTSGKGKVEEVAYDSIAKLFLRNGQNSITQHKIPTLEQVLELTQDKMFIYFDKAHQDPKGKPKGYKIKKILALLKEKNLLEQGVFVLDFPYQTAKEIFGEDLEKVNYVPVVSDKVENLENYVEEYINKLNPVAFQFRIASTDDISYKILPKIKASKSKCFVAATWKEHTAQHDDEASLSDPSKGWGWLVEQGFNIIETNYYEQLLDFLNRKNVRNLSGVKKK